MIAFDEIKKAKILPVVTIGDDVDPVKTARALLAGGINVIEVTFRTAGAAEAIKQIATNVPEMIVGAGTVKTIAQVDEAVTAGAKFLLSPCFDREVVSYAQVQKIPFIPGIQTATEINEALKMGINVVKFFPAVASGGVATIKSWSATFPEVSIIPTGGINIDNLHDFLDTPGVLAVGGSWLTPKVDPTSDHYATIENLAKSAMNEIYV